MHSGKNKARTIIIALLIIVSVFLSRHVWFDLIGSDKRTIDFIAYWASGSLLLSGENPYSSANILRVQQDAGWTADEPLVMYSPPWTLTFILPFCAGSYMAGKSMWLIFLLGLLFVSNHVLWSHYHGSEENRILSLIAVVSYVPVYCMMSKGQIVPLVLIGLVGFLHYSEKSKWWLAAFCTVCLTIKPQLTYLFWISLLLWVIHNRNWIFLSALAIVNLVFMSLPLFIQFHVYRDYLEQITGNSSAYSWATPLLGTHLRLIFGSENYWLQFIPGIISIVWMVCYYEKRKRHWDWKRELPIMLFVSLISTSYSWVNDYVLLLIALTHAAVWVSDGKALYGKPVLFGYVIANLVFLAQFLASTDEHLLGWYVPVLFALYLCLMKNVKPESRIMSKAKGLC